MANGAEKGEKLESPLKEDSKCNRSHWRVLGWDLACPEPYGTPSSGKLYSGRCAGEQREQRGLEKLP